MAAEVSTADDWSRRQQAQAAAFDRIGSRYDEVFPHKDGQRHIVDLLLARLPDAARVLDVGCGTGVPTARQLATAGCDVTGIDISPVMIDLARRNVPQATFVRRDATAVDADLGHFDAVTAFFSLLMLPRSQVTRTLTRLREILVPGGWLAVGMVEADLDDVELTFLNQPVRVSGWPREQLRRVLTSTGFTVDTEEVRSFAPAAPQAPPEVQLFLLARRDTAASPRLAGDPR
ncbi:class I SAM-dependent methyltransferase [Planosporangium sp. 12N6]|uniref:class I SAM-dependent methyltransferase n=1 Tax=Planosporangium spinosum TaxID=3402278 RepID=UPI003CF046B1